MADRGRVRSARGASRCRAAAGLWGAERGGPRARADGQARRWAERFVPLPPQHVQATKALMLATRGLPGPDIQAREQEIRNQLAELADSKEAVLAWMQKRPPVFRGA